MSFTSEGSNNNGYFFETTGMRRTSSRRSIRLHPGDNGRCTDVIENSSQNVQTFGDVYQNTSGQNDGPVWKTQSFLSKGICTVILWQIYQVNGNRESSIGRRLVKSSELENAYSLHAKENYSCL